MADILTLAIPWDDTATVDARLRAVADLMAHMAQAGELDQLPDDTRRFLGMVPMFLMCAAGDVAAERQERRYGRCCMCSGEWL